MEQQINRPVIEKESTLHPLIKMSRFPCLIPKSPMDLGNTQKD